MAKLGANVYRIAWVDYSRWLSGHDVVIHHGGAGIMWHCLPQEIPALGYPVDYDQFDHAARLEYSGKGIWLRGGLHQLTNAKPRLMELLSRRRVRANTR
ncbi:hypothetical protein O1Q98_03690 [Dickeya lacustris]|uniref:Erythromycin biosynthesis protein CIII-like C-terminal domain-containing protein n=2 Tax=Dickeya lacustris TaxID=2259638 RepID=A0ABY8G8Z8_9GAMM|nr:hypothetical protein [Dickeya lacustris]WFN56415.1 hypothetical protein O1Q98_03690 [Dickeya lacustris]